MTRRQVLFALGGAAALRAQERYPGVNYREYARVLPDFLAKLANEAYHRRNQALAQLTSAASIKQRQQWARDTFWKLTGGIPEKTPLNTRTTGSFERSGYRVDKLVYESQPGFHVAANLYIPTTGKPPYPAVLFQMGHAPNGKASPTYQRCCQGLVQLGYVVLGFDPMGQGERIYYPDASGIQTRLPSADEEHSLAGRQMLLTGDSATRMQTWDAVRSLDVLASHPQVDPSRIATSGQSGGATLSMFLVAVDDRIAASVVCSGNTENVACRDFIPPGSTDDAEQDFPGSAPLGWDRWDLFYPFAPKPMLITVSDKDFFGTYSPNYLTSGWEEFQKLKKVYDVMGHGDRLAWGDTPLPHGLSYDTRLLMYDWFGRWLKGGGAGIKEEPPTRLEPDETLWVSPKGSMVRGFRGETPHSLAVKRPVRRAAGAVGDLLGVVKPGRGVNAALLKRVPSREADIEALDIPSEAGVFLPAWRFRPKRIDPSKPMLVLLEPQGRLSRWHEDELYLTLAGMGYPVCVPDLRGVGDLTPAMGRGAARHARDHNNEEEYAWSSLILGRPLLGQRVTDVLAVLQAVHEPGTRLCLAAQGKMTVPALYAAMMNSDVSSLYLSGGLASFRSLVETEQYDYPFANFVPGIAGFMDLPEIIRSLAPRKVTVAGMVNASGQPAGAAVDRKMFGDAANVSVLDRAAWNPSTMVSSLR
ncbi:MAG: acetylxylan esterase [Bryobacteraceae bacterium]